MGSGHRISRLSGAHSFRALRAAPKKAQMADLTFEESLAEMEVALGIRVGFLTDLLREDDWSFVIKAQSLMEAAVSHLISHAVGKPELGDVFARLPLLSSRTGKMAFVEALHLLDSIDRQFVVGLTEIRNFLVHDVRQVTFRFPDYLSALDDEQLKKFRRTFGYFAGGNRTFQLAGKTAQVGAFVTDNPKVSVWYSLMNFVAAIYVYKDIIRLRNQVSRKGFQMLLPLSREPNGERTT